jgi:hypothetical protein
VASDTRNYRTSGIYKRGCDEHGYDGRPSSLSKKTEVGPRYRLGSLYDPVECCCHPEDCRMLDEALDVADAPARHLRTSVLSIITGGGKWVEITIPMDPLYLTVLVSAEKKFWRCVQSGETPHLINAEPPRPRIEAIRIVDMSSSNSWAEFAALFRSTRSAFLDHERAKSELKALIPEDAKEAIGHGVRAKRSKSGAVSFDVLETEPSHAAIQ